MPKTWITTSSIHVTAMVNSLNAACEAGFVPDTLHFLESPGAESPVAEAVEAGWDVERLAATPTRSDGVTIGSWHVETEWAREHNAGELGDRAFLQRVLETLEVESTPTGE